MNKLSYLFIIIICICLSACSYDLKHITLDEKSDAEWTEVKKSNNSGSAKITKPSGHSQKLRELKKLKDEGLLTDKEYEQKRKAIVDGM